MLRIAGTDWNSIPTTHAGFTTGPTLTDFAGGADGPFGYFLNTGAAVFGKTGGTDAIPAYGIATLASSGVAEPGISDPIFVRTRRSGVDLTLTHSSSAQITYTLTPPGSPRTFVFDDGTTWTGDDGVFYISTTGTAGAGDSVLQWRTNSRLLARKKDGFRWRHYGINSADLTVSTLGGASVWFENVFLEEDPSAGNTKQFSVGPSLLSGGSGAPSIVFNTCRWFQKAPRTVARHNAGGGGGHIRFLDCVFQYLGGGSGIAALPTAIAEHVYEFSRCKFEDINGLANPVITAPVSGTAASSATRIIFDQCEGVAPFTTSVTWTVASMNTSIIWREPGEGNAFRVESAGFVAEWRPGASIPTLNSMLLSGEPWAYKVLLRELSSTFIVRNPLQLCAKYRGASQVTNVDVELLVPSAATFDKSMLGIEVEYTDADDVVRHESSLSGMLATVLSAAAAIDSSSAAWTLNGLTGYAAKRLRLTTAYALKTGTAVAVNVRSVGVLPGAADKTIYVEPMPVFS